MSCRPHYVEDLTGPGTGIGARTGERPILQIKGGSLFEMALGVAIGAITQGPDWVTQGHSGAPMTVRVQEGGRSGYG